MVPDAGAGALPDDAAGAQEGGNAEVEGGPEAELRDTLESLGLELTETVRRRVLRLVEEDVPKANPTSEP